MSELRRARPCVVVPGGNAAPACRRRLALPRCTSATSKAFCCGQNSARRASICIRSQLAIVGSGSGGCLAARNDFRAALIERDRIGGACFQSGCYAVGTLQGSQVPHSCSVVRTVSAYLECWKCLNGSPEWFRCRQPGCNLRALSTRPHNEQSELAAGEPNRPGRN